MRANELRYGDVFRCNDWDKDEWMVCTGEVIDARGSTIRADTPDNDTFWEVPVCGWDPERKALAFGGPYIGIGIRKAVYLNLDAGGIARNQLNYNVRRIAAAMMEQR